MLKQKNKRKLKVLHLASFSGNIGDVANHEGFYKKIREIVSVKIEQLEIRKFYKNRGEMKFDDSFVKLVNQHDLLVLGGGGFFDLKWDYSNTGTTIDFSNKIIQEINIPVLVNGMGYHEYEDQKEQNMKKFNNFLDVITKKENWLVSVRNDGSLTRIFERYGKFADRILSVPDNGFFFDPKEYSNFVLKNKDIVWVGLNITNELFSKSFNRELDVTSFNDKISQFIDRILKENNDFKIILFPHVYQDIKTISLVLDKIEDKYKREKIMVAPLFMEKESVGKIFDLYRVCDCVIGMRFHTNVCCIGMNIPTIGLASHRQVLSLYEELGLSDRCVKVDSNKFTDELENKLKNSIVNAEKIKQEYFKINVSLNLRADKYYKKIKSFIEKYIS